MEEGDTIGMFSYGSGVCATFFTIRVHQTEDLHALVERMALLRHRLDSRDKVSCGEFYENTIIHIWL